MSVDRAISEAVDAAVARAVRAERDRLARILLRHGMYGAARDVECCDDEGDGVDACPACEGRGTVDHRGDDVPCSDCRGDGHRSPRVTA